MNRVKVTAVTVSRADYGLLRPVLARLKGDEYFDLSLAVTGSHLSALHGNTIDKIKEDGFEIDYVVDMETRGDTESDLCNSISMGIRGFSDIFGKNPPDMVIVLGDRYELWSTCIAAVIHKIPIAHIHGGEATYGVIDESVRHSVTKMASIHFPAIDLYAKRIVQMGENPGRVYVVGAPGIDNIKETVLMGKDELSSCTGAIFDDSVALMTYHPVTLDDYQSASAQVCEVLEALLETELATLITMPNADTGGSSIYREIERYANNYPGRFKLVKNLGQKAYLSAMKYARVMVGNSSSGIIESASFGLPVVNIGDRQAGRFKPDNIIDCDCSKESIREAIDRALSEDFARFISGLQNPYGDGRAADKIVKVLKSIDFRNKSSLLKKEFFELLFDISAGKVI